MKPLNKAIRREMLRLFKESIEPWLQKDPEYKDCPECEGTGRKDVGWLPTNYSGPVYDSQGNVVENPQRDEFEHIIDSPENILYGLCNHCDGTGQVEKTSDDLQNDRDSAMEDNIDRDF